MNFEILKIPSLRRRIFTNTKLDLYNDNINKIFKFNDLKYVDDLGVLRLNLKQKEFGYYYDPTVTEFVKVFIFGNISTSTLNTKIDFDNFTNSVLNGKNMRIPLQYRLENLLKSTNAEQLFWNNLFENKYAKKLRSISGLKLNQAKLPQKLKGFRLVQQSILPVDDGGFYIADFVLQVYGFKPLLIEIDGSYHSEYEQKIYDLNRSKQICQKYNYNVLRVTNQQVIENFDFVFESILNQLKIEDIKINECEIFNFKTLKSFIRFLNSNLDTLEFRSFDIKFYQDKIEVKSFKNNINFNNHKFSISRLFDGGHILFSDILQIVSEFKLLLKQNKKL